MIPSPHPAHDFKGNDRGDTDVLYRAVRTCQCEEFLQGSFAFATHVCHNPAPRPPNPEKLGLSPSPAHCGGARRKGLPKSLQQWATGAGLRNPVPRGQAHHPPLCWEPDWLGQHLSVQLLARITLDEFLNSLPLRLSNGKEEPLT